MNKFGRCEKCLDWHWTESECRPIYFAYHEDYLGEDPKAVRGSSHEDAALEYGKWYNGSECDLMNDTININIEKDGVVKYFRVGAEPEIHYTITEISSPLEF
jgi:hypothetical protein